MHALIVAAHPEAQSLTHSVAARIGIGLKDAGHSFEIADLSAEGFDPRFTRGDLAVHRRQAERPADVAAEQARIERADTLVLVFPVYWWSMPAQLKGWIDRVFSNGWAFDFKDGSVTKKLQHLTVHLVGLAGDDAASFDRHGYRDSFRTQIDYGIFAYCGARVLTSEILFETETQDPAVHLEKAQRIGAGIFDQKAAPVAAE